MNMYRGKTAYVTGGSSGIGFAIAGRLVRSGCNVVLIARNAERLQEAARQLESQAPADVAVSHVCADVSAREKLETAMQETVVSAGPPDIVVNCAGIAHPGYFEQIPQDVFQRLLAINLAGVWNLTQILVKHIRERHGIIVNVSSLSGIAGTFGYTAYAASKWGVIGFSEALRNELSPDGVRVCVLCPPDTNTPQLEAENRIKPPETRAVSEGARFLEPEQVAKACLKGMSRGKFLIIPGAMSKIVYTLKRIFPRLVYRIIDNDVKKCRQNMQRTNVAASTGSNRERKGT